MIKMMLERRKNRLESKPSSPEKKKPNLDQLPKVGVFGWLKRFIGNIMGLFLMKMVEYADLSARYKNH